MKSGRWINLGKGKSNTQQAFWALIGAISSFSLAIVSSAILSRYLSKEEYGTYKQIIYIYSALLVVFTAGLPQVFEYFLPRYKLEEGRSIVWKITKLLFIGGALFSIFLFLFSGYLAEFLKNPELERGIKYFSPIPMLLLPTLGIEGIFSTYKKTIYIGIYNTLTRLLMLCFIVLPVILWHGSYITAIYGWIVVSVISLLVAFFFKELPFRGIKSEKASLDYNSIFSYSLPLVAASLWGIAIKSADQFYISRYFGTAVFAEFSNGFVQLPFVSMITSSVSLVLMPVFSKMVHDKSDLTELSIIWRNALHKSAILIYPLILFFIFFANDIILILFSKAYLASITYFRINMLLNFFNIIIFAPLLFSLGKTKLYARIHMIYAVVVWVLEYLVIYFFDSPYGVAITSVSLGIVSIIVFMHYTSKLINIKLGDLIPFKQLSKILIHSLIISIIVKFVMNSIYTGSNLIELFLAAIIFATILILTSGLFNLNYLANIKPLFLTSKHTSGI